MNPDLLLRLVSTLAEFALKSMAAFGVWLLWDRLLPSARQRFILWSVFVYGTAAYWLYRVCLVFFVTSAPGGLALGVERPLTLGVGTWQVPPSWAWPASFAMSVVNIAYLAVLSFFLCTYIRKRLHLRWVLRFSQQPPIEVADTFRDLAETFYASRARLLLLSGATSPATFGWIRPTVLLPTECLKQDGAELEDILRHELQHIRRCDSLWNELAGACRALLFFQPALWYGVRRMQFERELACDLAVISHTPARREDYAECLLRFARRNLVPEPGTWGIDFAASAQHLSARVHAILAAPRRISGWLLGVRIGSGFALFVLLIGLFPSMAVLLSYAPAPVSQLSAPAVHTVTQTLKRSSGRSRGGRLSTTFPASALQTQDALPRSSPLIADESPTVESTSPRGETAGPQLVHRGMRNAQAARTSQSVSLTDSDSGDKDATLDRKQAVQQGATAALGMYRRLSALDRR